MRKEFKDFIFTRTPFNLVQIAKAGRGGSIPAELSGTFTSLVHAEQAVNSYLAGKTKNGSKQK